MRKGLAIAVLVLIAAGIAAWRFGLVDRLGLGGDDDASLTLYGNDDIRQVELGFRVPGRIERMLYEEGDPVAAGAVVATLDKRHFQDDVRQAKAGVAAQAANLAKLEAGSRPETIAQARDTVAARVPTPPQAPPRQEHPSTHESARPLSKTPHSNQ